MDIESSMSKEDLSKEAKELCEYKERIRYAFDLLDDSKRNTVSKHDIGTLIRFLGFFPTNHDLRHVIMPELIAMQTQTQQQQQQQQRDNPNDNDGNGETISYQVFESKVLDMKRRAEYQCENPDIIMHAFQTLETYFVKQQQQQQQQQPQGMDELQGFILKDDLLTLIQQQPTSTRNTTNNAHSTNTGTSYHQMNEKECEDFMKLAVANTNRKKKGHKIYYDDYVEELMLQLSHALTLH